MDDDKAQTTAVVLPEIIERKIYLIREKKVMLDSDLAKLYGVETRTLNQSVKRNLERFPEDFMFRLERDEILRLSQFVITSEIKYAPSVHAFTEQGVAMLSSVLRSHRAIQVNIQIMRTFTKLRELLLTHSDLKRKIEEIEKKYDQQFVTCSLHPLAQYHMRQRHPKNAQVEGQAPTVNVFEV